MSTSIGNKGLKELPMIEINLEKIRHNVKVVGELCYKVGIEPVGITKVSNGSVEIAQALLDGGVNIIGDSRLKNLKRYFNLDAKKMLIRLPMISEVKDLVQYADISLNSEIKVIRKISEEAKMINKVHEIILMIEVGDLREGIYDRNEIMEIVRETLELEGVKLVGIGTNLNCFGSIKPSKENLGILIDIKNEIKKEFGVELETVSGGNSGSLALVLNGEMPKGVNQIRIGTAFLLGLIEVNLPRITNTYDDAFKLFAEIIEIKNKPSKPFGEFGVDAFRNTPIFQDKGIRKRAICAIGKQDCDPNFMYPEDKRVEIIGSSSDHLLLDITDCEKSYEIGDKVSFVLDYVAILRAMTSDHVSKVYVG